MKKNYVSNIVLSALLCSIGIIIPTFSPYKIILEPASFTLGSHIAIFLAMFISPSVAFTVSVGTTLGFLLGGFPIVIVFRAATHVVFALTGALLLRKNPTLIKTPAKTVLFALGIGIIHAVCEVFVVMPFYFGNNMASAYYAKGFMISVLLLVGLGTVVHSIVDFTMSIIIWKAVSASRGRAVNTTATKT